MNEAELQRDIERLRGHKIENLEKLEEARTINEKAHFRLLAEKNEAMIKKYKEEMQDA